MVKHMWCLFDKKSPQNEVIDSEDYERNLTRKAAPSCCTVNFITEVDVPGRGISHLPDGF